MAGIREVAQTGEITCSAGASITLLQIIAPTNQRLVVKEISVSFKGTSNTEPPVRVDILRQTTAGTMTALTPSKLDSTDDETLQATAQHTATGEPTASSVLQTEEVHPQTGYLWQGQVGWELIVPGGTRLGVRVVAGSATTAAARMVFEE